jgi:hypothetical protein
VSDRCDNVINLDEWRARRTPPDHPAPSAAPQLRLVDRTTEPAFTLDTFMTRARVVMAEMGQPALQLVSAPVIPLPVSAPAQAG